MNKVDLEIYRGDTNDVQVTHDYSASEISLARFYVRRAIDGDLLLRLRSDEKASQFTINDQSLQVRILPGDTDGLPPGRWRYDVELQLTDGSVYTVQYGLCKLIGDVSTDVATDSLPSAPEYYVTALEKAALEAAEFPSAENEFMTSSAVDGKVASYLNQKVGITVAQLELPSEEDDEYPTATTSPMEVRPTLAVWQYTQGGEQDVSGTLRMELGTGTLDANGQATVTFQQVFAEVLLVMLQDYTAANAMYPSGIGTSGFTANGTPNDGFGWLAIGRD